MNRITIAAISLLSLLCSAHAYAGTFGSAPDLFDVEFVTVGNPGNPADLSGNPKPAGRVDYIYNMGKFEISREMIETASFLGGLQLDMDPMDFVTGGARPAMPATGISWNEAARFANWLNTSQGFPAAYKFRTQPGEVGYHPNSNIELWEPDDFGYDSSNLFRNSQARYFLPSAHEWYKAAYYDPNAFDGEGGYYNYPIGTSELPIPVASGTEPFTAVHLQSQAQGPADITQAGGLSPYGVMGMGGNVWEWEESELDLVNDVPFSIRGVRGGRWFNAPGHLNVFDRDDDDFPTFELFNTGFRVASRPERNTQVEMEVSPGVGRFENDGDNVLVVEEIQDGYRVRAVQAGPPYMYEEAPQFSASWDDLGDDQWVRFDADIASVITENDLPGTPVNDLLSTQGFSFDSGSQVIRPNEDGFDFSWPFPPSEEFGETIVTWEFTATPIDAPVVGDTNADGTVGFLDFLALATNFGQQNQGWSGGDFNGDTFTNFIDFIALANNFGTSPPAAAATASIPEPSSSLLVRLGALFAIATVRKKRKTCPVT